MEFSIEPSLLKDLIDLDQEDIFSFKIKEDRIIVSSIDTAKISLFSVEVTNGTLGGFKINPDEIDTIINVKKDTLLQIHKLASPSDNIKITKENENTLKFDVGLIERSVKTLTDTAWRQIPSIKKPETSVTMKSEMLKKIIKASQAVSDELTFVASNKGLSIGNKTTDQSAKIAIPKDLLLNTSFDEPISSIYPLEKLTFFIGNVSTETVSLSFEKDNPITIEFELISNTKLNPKVTVIIAPRVPPPS